MVPGKVCVLTLVVTDGKHWGLGRILETPSVHRGWFYESPGPDPGQKALAGGGGVADTYFPVGRGVGRASRNLEGFQDLKGSFTTVY